MSEPNQTAQPAEEMSEQQLSELLQIRRDKLQALQEAGKDPYTITKFDVTAKNADIRARFEELENTRVTIAGRMMSRRIMGKASFMDVRDGSDRMQVYVKRDDVGEEDYADFKKWDIGDIVGVEGFVFQVGS